MEIVVECECDGIRTALLPSMACHVLHVAGLQRGANPPGLVSSRDEEGWRRGGSSGHRRSEPAGLTSFLSRFNRVLSRRRPDRNSPFIVFRAENVTSLSPL